LSSRQSPEVTCVVICGIRRDAEVLSLFAMIINRLREKMEAEVSATTRNSATFAVAAAQGYTAPKPKHGLLSVAPGA
jgi:hypothetical protein